jgi:hypothetical protein
MIPLVRIAVLPPLVSVLRTHRRLYTAEQAARVSVGPLRASPATLLALLFGSALVVYLPVASVTAVVAPELLLRAAWGLGSIADLAFITPDIVVQTQFVVALAVSPVVLAYLQRRANSLWKSAGHLVHEGPVDDAPRYDVGSRDSPGIPGGGG